MSHSEHLRSEKGSRRRNEINVLYGMILQHVESDREANISELLPKEPLKVLLPPLRLLTPPADPAWITAPAPGPISGPKPPTTQKNPDPEATPHNASKAARATISGGEGGIQPPKREVLIFCSSSLRFLTLLEKNEGGNAGKGKKGKKGNGRAGDINYDPRPRREREGGSSRTYPTKPLVRSSIGSPLCAPSSQPVRHADRLLCLSVLEQRAVSYSLSQVEAWKWQKVPSS